MKIVIASLIGFFVWSSFAVAQAPTSVVSDYKLESMGLKYLGSPKIAEGRLKSDTIVLEQSLVYAKTASLKSKVVTTEGLVPRKLETGTKLFFASNPDRWCTYERKNQVCLTFDDGVWKWQEDYRGLDVTWPFRAAYAACCEWDAQMQLETVAATSTPIFQDITDNRTVYTSVVSLRDVSAAHGTLSVDIYCYPRDEPEWRVSCGYRTGSIDLNQKDLDYTTDDVATMRIHFDANDHTFSVTRNSMDADHIDK